MDDGSTDDSREVIAAYGDRVRSVFKENGGQASAFNAGFDASTGEVVCYLDADDLLDRFALERAIAALEQGAVKAHWPLRLIDAAGHPLEGFAPEGELSQGDLRDALLARGPGNHCAPPTSGNAWRRDYLAEVLPIPPEFRTHADAYLLELAPLFGPLAKLGEPAGAYRLHGANGVAATPFDERLPQELEVHGRVRDAVERACARLGLHCDRSGWDGDRWLRQALLFGEDIDAALPGGEPFILADEGRLDLEARAGRPAVPFPERDGTYWGRPPDDETAVVELERLRGRGHRFLVFAWPAFWWLDHYHALARCLAKTADERLRTDRAIVFALD